MYTRMQDMVFCGLSLGRILDFELEVGMDS